MKIEIEIARTNRNTLEGEAVLFTRRDVQQAVRDVVDFVTGFNTEKWTAWRVKDVSVWNDGEVIADNQSVIVKRGIKS